MFGFSGAIKFYYCPTPISMRKSFDGLAGAVEEYIQQEPESGHAFTFPIRRKGGLNCPVENLQRSCPGSNRIAITKDTRKSLDWT